MIPVSKARPATATASPSLASHVCAVCIYFLTSFYLIFFVSLRPLSPTLSPIKAIQRHSKRQRLRRDAGSQIKEATWMLAGLVESRRNGIRHLGRLSTTSPVTCWRAHHLAIIIAGIRVLCQLGHATALFTTWRTFPDPRVG